MSTRPKRKPKPKEAHVSVQCAQRFATVESVLARLRRGEYEVAVIDGREVPIYRDLVTGGQYHLVPALDGWCTFIEKLGEWTGRPVPLAGHRAVVAAIREGSDLYEVDLDAMAAEIVQHKAAYLATTLQDRCQIAQAARVKNELKRYASDGKN